MEYSSKLPSKEMDCVWYLWLFYTERDNFCGTIATPTFDAYPRRVNWAYLQLGPSSWQLPCSSSSLQPRDSQQLNTAGNSGFRTASNDWVFRLHGKKAKISKDWCRTYMWFKQVSFNLPVKSPNRFQRKSQSFSTPAISREALASRHRPWSPYFSINRWPLDRLPSSETPTQDIPRPSNGDRYQYIQYVLLL